MKKVISLLMVLFLMMTLLVGCNSDKEQISLYFKDKQTNNLNEEKRMVKADKRASAEELAKIAVGELIKGPLNEINSSVISKEAKLLSLAVNDGVATINMSAHYSEKKDVEALLLRFALVNTLCSIDGIEGIVILVEGKAVMSEITGKELGVLSMNDIALNTQSPQVAEKTTIRLYFPSSEGNYLKEELRSVEIQNALSLEKTVVSELIKGPQKDGLIASVADGTKLLGIETKDKVCCVNFSGEFVSKLSSGTMATTLTLYSVVNSLCALEGVESVQILINGETGVEFGNIMLGELEGANEEYVK